MISHPQGKPEVQAASDHAVQGIDWETELRGLLNRAAEIAAQSGLAPEAFATAAWNAYLQASPGLAEHLADLQIDAAVEHLRHTGRLAKA